LLLDQWEERSAKIVFEPTTPLKKFLCDVCLGNPFPRQETLWPCKDLAREKIAIWTSWILWKKKWRLLSEFIVTQNAEAAIEYFDGNPGTALNPSSSLLTAGKK